jgi:serine/threonine-protein kinase RsbT
MIDWPPSEFRLRVRIRHESDIVTARRQVRELGTRQGLSSAAIEALATAVTEVARNLVVHAGSGEVLFATAEDARRRGVLVTVRDDGPGIADIEQAMQDGFSTKGGGLGSGLPGARRLVDEFHIESDLDSGTTVTMRQWAVSE